MGGAACLPPRKTRCPIPSPFSGGGGPRRWLLDGTSTGGCFIRPTATTANGVGAAATAATATAAGLPTGRRLPSNCTTWRHRPAPFPTFPWRWWPPGRPSLGAAGPRSLPTRRRRRRRRQRRRRWGRRSQRRWAATRRRSGALPMACRRGTPGGGRERRPWSRTLTRSLRASSATARGAWHCPLGVVVVGAVVVVMATGWPTRRGRRAEGA
ncbi:hypothetical protein I4F81_012864 [Pyropia yezoensis]|uniref:Uncharacterized protein n=1 Tax=Pyropia yezoensis TaxID=2788 RepID=A0ACC3CJP9_PYRYE|nr:hypothetical protein I4F81_012864 [Neopyropia yezoensis]